MQVSPHQWLNIAAVAGIGAMMVATGFETGAFDGEPGIDTIVTGSVTGGAAAAASANRFMAIDHRSDRTCVMSLHRAAGYDVHRIEPGLDCDALGSEFAAARAWREDGRGLVTITDHRGKTLMRLSHGDGFAYDVVHPGDRHVSLSAY